MKNVKDRRSERYSNHLTLTDVDSKYFTAQTQICMCRILKHGNAKYAKNAIDIYIFVS